MMNVFNLLGMAVLMALNYIAYQGILAEAETHRDANKLAGGWYLDLLGLVWVVQFGTAVISKHFYYLLTLLPLVGGWKLYSTFKGVKGDFTGASAAVETKGTTPSEKETKRIKRAEQRQQKWS